MQVEDKLDIIIQKLQDHDRRFNQQDARLDRLEADMRWMRDKLMDVWESRKEVVIHFTWKWATASVGISFGVSLVVVTVANLLVQ